MIEYDGWIQGHHHVRAWNEYACTRSQYCTGADVAKVHKLEVPGACLSALSAPPVHTKAALSRSQDRAQRPPEVESLGYLETDQAIETDKTGQFAVCEANEAFYQRRYTMG